MLCREDAVGPHNSSVDNSGNASVSDQVPARDFEQMQSVEPQQLLSLIDTMQAELDKLRDDQSRARYQAQRVEEELRLAARLQRDFLPKSLPNHGRVRFNRLYIPAGHVSGDLYDVRRLDEKWAGVYLADAIGHGMPAALLAMFLHNALVTKRIDISTAPGYHLLGSELAMQSLNESLCAQGLQHATFATALYARVNFDTGDIDLSRAGHPYPMLIRAGGKVEEVGEDGALLGILPDETFTPYHTRLEPGDKLICFTDGVETAFKPDDAVSDMQYWRDLIAEHRHLRADELLSTLWHLRDGKPAEDDVTVVTIEMQ